MEEDLDGASATSRAFQTPSQNMDYRAPIAPRREILSGGGGFGHHDMFEQEFGSKFLVRLDVLWSCGCQEYDSSSETLVGHNPNIMRNLGLGRPVTRQTVDPFRDYDREAAVVRGAEGLSDSCPQLCLGKGRRRPPTIPYLHSSIASHR